MVSKSKSLRHRRPPPPGTGGTEIPLVSSVPSGSTTEAREIRPRTSCAKKPLRTVKESVDTPPGVAEHRRDWTGMRNCGVQASRRSPAPEMRCGSLSSQPARLPAHCERGHRREKDAAPLAEGQPHHGAAPRRGALAHARSTRSRPPDSNAKKCAT